MVDLTSSVGGGDNSDNSENTIKHGNRAAATAASRQLALSSTGIWSQADNILLVKLVRKYISESKGSYPSTTDWEPIAKELGRGKSAKECEAHWVRHNFHINLIKSRYGPPPEDDDDE